MVESWGTLAYELIPELFLATALFWAMAVFVVRFFGITDAAWRARFFLLPILVPVVAVPLVHLIIRPFLSGFSDPPLENFLVSLMHVSPLVHVFFLSLAGLALSSGAVYALLPLVAAGHHRWMWQHQRQQLPQWARCRSILNSVASRLHIPPPRLILSNNRNCSSLTLGSFRSYVVVSEVLASILDDEELEGLLAHELGHIKRQDTLLGAAVGVCRHFLNFSPFCHSAYRRFARAREEAVDDLAVRISGHPLALASCLVKAYRLSKDSGQLISGSTLLPSSEDVDNRISRLLMSPSNAVRPLRRYFWAFSGVIVLGIAFLMLLV